MADTGAAAEAIGEFKSGIMAPLGKMCKDEKLDQPFGTPSLCPTRVYEAALDLKNIDRRCFLPPFDHGPEGRRSKPQHNHAHCAKDVGEYRDVPRTNGKLNRGRKAVVNFYDAGVDGQETSLAGSC